MSVRLVIMQENMPVADVADYNGPIPTVGSYILHPRHSQNVMGKVTVVTLHIIDTHVSSVVHDNPVYDTESGNPVVEVTIGG